VTWLLDGNLLVALRLPGHEHHKRAHRWFAAIAPASFSTCVVTQGTLLRLHMSFADDRRAVAAWQALQEVMAHPRHAFWEDGFSYENVGHEGLQGHRQVTDAWLAELARRRGGRVATLDAPLATLHADVATLLPV
jgi:hypothetical protein